LWLRDKIYWRESNKVGAAAVGAPHSLSTLIDRASIEERRDLINMVFRVV